MFIKKYIYDPFDKIVSNFLNSTHQGRYIFVFLAYYVLSWTMAGTLLNSYQDVHVDMSEIVGWCNLGLFLGSPKGPPLGTWMANVWFYFLPYRDWTFYLLSMIMPAFALWFSWKIFIKYLEPTKALLSLFLLTFIPFYNFFSLKFNANTVQMPFWAMATYYFLYSLETQKIKFAFLTGLSIALAIYGKYWSILLILSFFTAALFSPYRSKYFRSLSPWIMLSTIFGVLVPHLLWAIQNGFTSFQYPFKVNNTDIYNSVKDGMYFIKGSLCYAIIPILLSFKIREKIISLNINSQHKLFITIFFSTIFWACCIGLLFHVSICALWMIPAMTLVPLILLYDCQSILSRKFIVKTSLYVCFFPIFVMIFSPIISMYQHLTAQKDRQHYQLMAQTVQQHVIHDSKLFGVLGGFGPVFYLPKDVLFFDIDNPNYTPWITREDIQRNGICLVDSGTSHNSENFEKTVDEFTSLGMTAITEYKTIEKTYLGIKGPAVNYKIVVLLPKKESPSEAHSMSTIPATSM